jgi:hypothetical protein
MLLLMFVPNMHAQEYYIIESSSIQCQISSDGGIYSQQCWDAGGGQVFDYKLTATVECDLYEDGVYVQTELPTVYSEADAFCQDGTWVGFEVAGYEYDSEQEVEAWAQVDDDFGEAEAYYWMECDGTSGRQSNFIWCGSATS